VDSAILEAARRGDRIACGKLLTSLQDVWYRFSLAQLHDPELAADATQETGLRFLRQLAQFRGESQLQTWSLGIALNVVRELRRKKMGGVELDEEAEVRSDVDPVADLQKLDDRQRLREAMSGLSSRQREVLTLRYFEDLSTEETATAMNCAAGTVKATLHQALRALKARLSGGAS
jgi:RNA polymerase sigma-70 factor (ECF subfamily)